MASAQEKIAASANSLSTKTNDVWSLFTYGAKAYIDKETRADDKRAPGVEDLMYQNGYATPMQQNGSGGINPLLIGGALVGVVLVAVLVMRKR